MTNDLSHREFRVAAALLFAVLTLETGVALAQSSELGSIFEIDPAVALNGFALLSGAIVLLFEAYRRDGYSFPHAALSDTDRSAAAPPRKRREGFTATVMLPVGPAGLARRPGRLPGRTRGAAGSPAGGRPP